MDIVRIFEDIAEANDMIYHYGSQQVINLIDTKVEALQEGKIYFLHERTNRTSEYNSFGTAIAANVYDGKFFLVKQGKLDQHYFQEVGTQAASKYSTNIEPLLAVFRTIGNNLGCSNITVIAWSNIDVSNVLDANMDGLLCTYKVKVPVAYVPPVSPPTDPPVFSSPDVLNIFNGVDFTFQVVASGNPTFSLQGVTFGTIAINPNTGLITGKVFGAETQYNIQVVATNSAGTTTQELTINKAILSPPVITSNAQAKYFQNVPFTYQITATNNPTSFGATGLPTGLTVNTSTGLISGTSTAFSINFTVSASNAAGTGTKQVTKDSIAPTTPTNLHATEITATTVKLNWDLATDNVQVAGYDIFKNGVYDVLMTNNIGFFIMLNQTPGSSNTFAVRSRDANGNVSELSEEIVVTQLSE